MQTRGVRGNPRQLAMSRHTKTQKNTEKHKNNINIFFSGSHCPHQDVLHQWSESRKALQKR
jgi:hypothetical protein